MANKYLKAGTSGFAEEFEGLVTSAGAGDAGKILALDSTGKLDTSVMPTGIGAEVKILVASEGLSAGDYVNIWNDSSTPKARKADGTDVGKKADGFVLAAVTSGANATVYLGGINNQKSGLTGGLNYFLSVTVPGGVQTTIATTAGHIVQFLGKGLSATEIDTNVSTPIVRA